MLSNLEPTAVDDSGHHGGLSLVDSSGSFERWQWDKHPVLLAHSHIQSLQHTQGRTCQVCPRNIWLLNLKRSITIHYCLIALWMGRSQLVHESISEFVHLMSFLLAGGRSVHAITHSDWVVLYKRRQYQYLGAGWKSSRMWTHLKGRVHRQANKVWVGTSSLVTGQNFVLITSTHTKTYTRIDWSYTIHCR